MDLKAVVDYPSLGTNMPLLAVMHGYQGTSTNFVASVRHRLATYYGKVFLLLVEMRGRGGSEGAKDDSGREIYDIIDAIDYCITNYPAQIDANQIHIVGYSGGGGNAFACAAKFPDKFNTITTFFGMSDYGHDAVDGWYQNITIDYQALMEAAIGGSPTTTPNNYYARSAVDAITNYSGGYLRMYHDIADGLVKPVHSQRVASAMSAAGLSNYMLSISQLTDDPRWIHGYPQLETVGAPCIQAEAQFMPNIINKTHAAWTIPASGTITVIGYIVTKRFSIWLNSGLDAVATVVYNTTINTYTVTPLTGEVIVVITQGTKTATQTISTETEMVVS